MFNTRRFRIGIIAGGIAVCVAAFTGVSQQIIADRADQKSDFTGDLQHLGYSITTPASWDDESNGFWSGSVLETEVQVAGCAVELERSDGAEAHRSVRGRGIEYFRIDQIGNIEDVTKSPLGALTPADVEQFLRSINPAPKCLKRR